MNQAQINNNNLFRNGEYYCPFASSAPREHHPCGTWCPAFLEGLTSEEHKPDEEQYSTEQAYLVAYKRWTLTTKKVVKLACFPQRVEYEIIN